MAMITNVRVRNYPRPLTQRLETSSRNRKSGIAATATVLLLVTLSAPPLFADSPELLFAPLGQGVNGETFAGSWGSRVVGSAGDMNGDGFDDVIVGAPYYNSAGPSTPTGFAFVYFGGAGADSVPDLTLTGLTKDEDFGIAVGTAGDVNGDGFDDVIVGAERTDVAGIDAGGAYVFYGGSVPDSTADIVLSGESAGDHFGAAVATAGDVNDDGFDDFIIGARWNNLNAGEAYLYYGGPGVDAIPDLTFAGSTSLGPQNLGISVGCAGDVNGDGFVDVIVGAHGTKVNFVSGVGAAYVYYGGPGADASPDLSLVGETEYSTFGLSVGAAGDMNGDGFDDVIVGAKGYSGSTGRAYVYYGAAVPDSTADLVFTGEAALDLFGWSVGAAGDVNDDGFSDVIVGARWNDGGGSDAGRVYIFHGGPGADSVADCTITGPSAADEFGHSVASAGDVDGDGIEDIIVGAPLAAGIGDPGRAFVYGFGAVGCSALSEDARIYASDPTAGAGFGRPVAMDGNRAIVGAAAVTSGGLGAAYILEYSAGAWSEVAKLQSGDNQAGDQFGTGVDISGDYAVVGANIVGTNVGAAYIFERDGLGIWNEVQKLTASDAEMSDALGVTVAISGDYALLGLNGEDGGAGNPLSGAGAAYVFERDSAGTWSEEAKLSASDALASNAFGIRLDVDGDVAVVAAQRGEAGATTDAGAVYVFERDGLGDWSEVQKLTASDAQPNDFFGSGVSISGGTILVGAKDEDGGAGDPLSGGGAAYVFERDGLGVWNESEKLQSCDAQAGDQFGVEVAVHGPVAVVGSHNEDGGPGDAVSNAGAAYVFDGVGANNWTPSAKLVATDAQSGDIFGRAVATNGARILVGARREDGGGGDPVADGGAVYAFETTLAVSVSEYAPAAVAATSAFHLSAAPNPFSSATTIQFTLRASERIDLSVYDVRGRRVRALMRDRPLSSGHHEVAWDGVDGTGREVSSGVYFYRMTGRSASETRRVVLLR
ncbi:T9SS type A sorting domain-containing protein [bacterium]|nr:T9SS type A sorting domain-containing protein [bacterium]